MHTPQRCRCCFTLAELVTVLGTLGVLGAALLPSVSSVGGKTQQANCAMNLRELGLAWNTFADDHDDWLLPASFPEKWPDLPAGFPDKAKTPGLWWERLIELGYIGAEAEGRDGIFHCPADPDPVQGSFAGRQVSLSYGYMDCYGNPYATNPRWPSSSVYGLQNRARLTKKPGRTPVMIEMWGPKKRGHSMIVPFGGYGIRPLSNWMHTPHDATGNILFDDGSVGAEPEAGTVAESIARDYF